MEHSTGDVVHASPGVANGTVFVGRLSLSYKHWPQSSSPAAARNRVYMGSNEGKLMAIDRKAQKTAWVFQTDGSQKSGAGLTQADGRPN
jgi:outer membrane protein assembly factor BamB